jgi:hypothetical protein
MIKKIVHYGLFIFLIVVICKIKNKSEYVTIDDKKRLPDAIIIG